MTVPVPTLTLAFLSPVKPSSKVLDNVIESFTVNASLLPASNTRSLAFKVAPIAFLLESKSAEPKVNLSAEIVRFAAVMPAAVPPAVPSLVSS